MRRLSNFWSERRAIAKAKATSDAIDVQIEEDIRTLRKQVKVLLLGASGSGKSTIVRQMIITHRGGFSREELMSYRPAIYHNILLSAQSIIETMQAIGVDFERPENKDNADTVMAYQIEDISTFVLPDLVAKAINSLWRDPIISTVMDHNNAFRLPDNAAYFLDAAPLMAENDYVPIEADVLHAKVVSVKTGIVETQLEMGTLSVRVIQVDGQRPERKKWIRCFEYITSLIYCVALSEYDEVELDGRKQNRMVEALISYESVINSRWFRGTSIILLLNKIDIFKRKLSKLPLGTYFPEYTGGDDVNKAAKYILWRFMQCNRARLSVYPHLIKATDGGDSTCRLVFAAVKATVLQCALRDSGLLD